MPIPRRSPLHLLAIAAVVTLACSASTSPGPRLIGEGDRVLFIGNSLTYVNDVPGIVQALADSGGTKIAVATVAGPNMALIDHWFEGTASREIKKGGWRFVVMQQGPTSVELFRDTLRLATKLFNGEIAKIGGTAALYSVWPTSNRQQDFPRAIESYRLAASDVNGIYLPVADAWNLVLGRDPTIALYSADGLHPTPAGSYLAGLVIYAKLLGRTPVGVPATLRLKESGSVMAIDATVAHALQVAAEEVTRAASVAR
jgi:hypothetical protein